MLLGVIISANQCNKNKTEALVKELSEKVWMHSNEEDQIDVQVYRVKDSYDFPPSRGREGFQLLPEGKFIKMGPSPNDAPQRQEGNWQVEGEQIRVKMSSGESYALEVVERQENFLKVKVIR